MEGESWTLTLSIAGIFSPWRALPPLVQAHRRHLA